VIFLLYLVHVIVCIFLILVVLLQQGKGADLSVFGGGSTQTAFGARSATTLLHKLTVVSFVLFIVTTMTIVVLKGSGSAGSVVEGAIPETATEAAPASPAPASTTPAPETVPATPPVTEQGASTSASAPAEAPAAPPQ
jgi:preprotein translocase subunit SecG